MIATRRRAGMWSTFGQSYSVTMSIPVLITQTVAGLAISAQVNVTPQGKATRGARAGEATLTLWRQSILGFWNIFSGPFTTPEGGLIGFGAFNYGDDSYRFTAKHVASGAEVEKRWLLKGNVVVSEDPLNVINVGTRMPAGWS